MDARSASSVITFVILFFALATGSSEGIRRAGKFYWANGIAVASSPEIEIDEDMAEELWIKCRLDLVQMKESDKNIYLNFPEQIAIGSNGINSEVQSLENGNLQKAISALPPQTIEILLDCLRKKDHFYISGEEGGSKNWYTKYMEFLFGWPEYSRRFLGGVLLQNVVSPAQAPAVEPPNYGPRPSSAPAPATSYIHPPVEAPKLPFFPRDFSDSSPQPSTSHSSVDPIVAPGTPSRKHNNRKPVVIAVVVTAVGTLVFASMLFFFYLKCYRSRTNTGSGDGQKDDRPLLSLGLSDYSVDYQFSGSSQRYSTHGSSINKDKYGTQLFNTNINQNGRSSSLNSNLSVKPDVHNSSPSEAPLSGRITGAAKTPVEPSTSSSNIHAAVPSLPLKLPPGRAGPAPHVPPIPSELQPPPPPIVRSNPPPPPSGPPRPPPSIPSGLRPPPPVPSGSPPPPPIPSGPRPEPPVPSGLRPPSPISSGPPPPPPPIPSARPRPPLPPGPPPPKNVFFPTPGNAVNEGTSLKAHAEAPKAKLKPFFWDKVLANPDHSMVWHQISSGSFQFNEEMIETLFGYAAADKNKNERKKESLSQDPSSQYVQLIDSKKSQNLSILLRALNVTTEEVCDALQEGNELPIELLEALLKMAPTAEEELKLRLFNGELSQLGPAERFLKVLVDIPFSFKRFDCLVFMGSLQEEASVIKESLATLEVACKELRNSRLFLKLLEAVLKTGNRMNDGTFRGGAQAFKLDTLLKLSDVKGTDGKTTLLHFVVQEIIRSEGVRTTRIARESKSISSVKSDDFIEDSPKETEEHYRSIGLQVVSGLGGELENVRKAAALDADNLIGTLSKLGRTLIRTKEFLNSEMKSSEDSGFHRTLKSFVEHAEIDITWLLEEEKRIMALVKNTADYFHGKAGKDEGLRLFVIVRDFLIMLDKVCKEVRESTMKPAKMPGNREVSNAQSSPDSRQPPPDLRQRLFPAITDRRIDNSSSDEE